jgi:hypothetical protein
MGQVYSSLLKLLLGPLMGSAKVLPTGGGDSMRTVDMMRAYYLQGRERGALWDAENVDISYVRCI